MATLANVRAGLLTRLQTITGVRAYSKWPDQIVTPAAMVRRMGSMPYTTFSGNGAHRFEIVAAVQLTDLERAQAALDLYTDLSGDDSIVAALEGDETLDGNAEYILLGDWSEDESVMIGTIEYLTATLPVEVHIAK